MLIFIKERQMNVTRIFEPNGHLYLKRKYIYIYIYVTCDPILWNLKFLVMLFKPYFLEKNVSRYGI